MLTLTAADILCEPDCGVYYRHNGIMKDLSVLQESPFTDRGSMVEIFADLNVWMGIRKVIESINDNAIAA